MARFTADPFTEAGRIASACSDLLDIHARLPGFKYADESIGIRFGQVTGRLIAAGLARLEAVADSAQLPPPCRRTTAHAEPIVVDEAPSVEEAPSVDAPEADDGDDAPEADDDDDAPEAEPVSASNAPDDQAPTATSDTPAAPVEVS